MARNRKRYVYSSKNEKKTITKRINDFVDIVC